MSELTKDEWNAQLEKWRTAIQTIILNRELSNNTAHMKVVDAIVIVDSLLSMLAEMQDDE